MGEIPYLSIRILFITLLGLQRLLLRKESLKPSPRSLIHRVKANNGSARLHLFEYPS